MWTWDRCLNLSVGSLCLFRKPLEQQVVLMTGSQVRNPNVETIVGICGRVRQWAEGAGIQGFRGLRERAPGLDEQSRMSCRSPSAPLSNSGSGMPGEAARTRALDGNWTAEKVEELLFCDQTSPRHRGHPDLVRCHPHTRS